MPEEEMLMDNEECLGDFDLRAEAEPAPEYTEPGFDARAEEPSPEEPECLDPVAQNLSEYAGGKPEDWKEEQNVTYRGEGYIFDGKEIINPRTGEDYWGNVERTPEFDVKHQEVIHAFNEDGPQIVCLDVYHEATSEGEKVFTTLIIKEADKSVRYEIRETLIKNREDEELPAYPHDGARDQEERKGSVGYREDAPNERDGMAPVPDAEPAYAHAEESSENTNGIPEELPVDAVPSIAAEATGHMPETRVSEKSAVTIHELQEDAPAPVRAATPLSERHEPAHSPDTQGRSAEQATDTGRISGEPHREAHTGESERRLEQLEPAPVFAQKNEHFESPAIERLHEANLFAVIEPPHETRSHETISTVEESHVEHVRATAETTGRDTETAADNKTAHTYGFEKPLPRTELISPTTLERFLKEAPLELTFSDVHSESSGRDTQPERVSGTEGVTVKTAETFVPIQDEQARTDARESEPVQNARGEQVRTGERRTSNPLEVTPAERSIPRALERTYAAALLRLRSSPPPAKDIKPERERAHKLNGITLHRAA